MIRASGSQLQAEVALDYLGRGEVTLGLKIARNDKELRAAISHLEDLLVRRAKAAVAHIQMTPNG